MYPITSEEVVRRAAKVDMKTDSSITIGSRGWIQAHREFSAMSVGSGRSCGRASISCGSTLPCSGPGERGVLLGLLAARLELVVFGEDLSHSALCPLTHSIVICPGPGSLALFLSGKSIDSRVALQVGRA